MNPGGDTGVFLLLTAEVCTIGTLSEPKRLWTFGGIPTIRVSALVECLDELGNIIMSKRLEAMRANPRNNWQMSDVVALCREFGVSCEQPRGGGSHNKIAHPHVHRILTVPSKRPIKPVYIKQLVAFIDELRSLS